MAGIAAEVIANRLGVGPEKDCKECKFEEFFLSSWAVGDPAMVVDNPATGPDGSTGGPPATKAFFPDDPSNVYHSYLRDHVKFRIHNGATQPHVHHQHAHQWLHSPNSDNSAYLDSQMIVPGSSYTLEIAWGGSGNRNFTAGDSIFHCHFYPHFAEGMWSLWRVHDVFESGTELDANGRPVSGARALPDGEIVVERLYRPSCRYRLWVWRRFRLRLDLSTAARAPKCFPTRRRPQGVQKSRIPLLRAG